MDSRLSSIDGARRARRRTLILRPPRPDSKPAGVKSCERLAGGGSSCGRMGWTFGGERECTTPVSPRPSKGGASSTRCSACAGAEWRALPAAARAEAAREAAARPGRRCGSASEGATAAVTLLGHKGDLMLVHFRRSFEDLQAAQLQVARLSLAAHLEATTSYVSVVELGMYEMTAQIHGRLREKGLAAGSEDFEKAFDLEMEEQRKRVEGRLFLRDPGAAARLLLPDEQAAGRGQELVRGAGGRARRG